MASKVMTIGIDIRVLGSGRKSGIEEYTEQLLVHMLPLDPTVQYKLFYSSLTRPVPHREWFSLPNVSVHAFRMPYKLLLASSYLFHRPRIDQMLGGVDVFFSPHFFLSPLSSSSKRVTTFHDLSYLRVPEFFSWRRRIWHTLEMKPSWQARFSERLIAVSDSTKKDLADLYRIDPARISVIPSGVGDMFTRPSESPLTKFRHDHHLPEKFILFLGTLEPRKNITGIIQAFDMLKNSGAGDQVHLVIAGAKGWLYRDIFKTAHRSPYGDRIHFVGHVTDEERPFYYSLAAMFVYPSFFEGFGFPPLEAMACGTPVIASNSTSLPEVVGDAGLLVNPHSASDITRAMKNILTDEKLRLNLITKGLERAKKFTWEKAARETLNILTSVAE